MNKAASPASKNSDVQLYITVKLYGRFRGVVGVDKSTGERQQTHAEREREEGWGFVSFLHFFVARAVTSAELRLDQVGQ